MMHLRTILQATSRVRASLVAIWLAFALLFCGQAHADHEHEVTRPAVVALVDQAVDLVLKEGVDAARAKFHTDPHFKHGQIYVCVIDFEGTWLVYPPRPSGEGKSVLDVKDSDGKFLVREIIAVAKSPGTGWVDYSWLNPATNRIQPKSTYVKRVPDRNLIVYVGIYKES